MKVSYGPLSNSVICYPQCVDPTCQVQQHIGCVVIPEKTKDCSPPPLFYCEMCRLKRADPYVLCICSLGLMCLYYEMKIYMVPIKMPIFSYIEWKVYHWFGKMCLILNIPQEGYCYVTLPIVQCFRRKAGI